MCPSWCEPRWHTCSSRPSTRSSTANGRVGRLLITLLLYDAGILRQPLLYLSLFFKEHRTAYYELLNRVRRTGDWGILARVLPGRRRGDRRSRPCPRQTDCRTCSARIATGSSRREDAAPGPPCACTRPLKARPILSLPVASKEAGLSFQAAASAMDTLARHGRRPGDHRKAPRTALRLRCVPVDPHRGHGPSLIAMPDRPGSGPGKAASARPCPPLWHDEAQGVFAPRRHRPIPRKQA